MDLDVKGRAYIVTGGSRGLGFATAARLAAEGAHVLVASRDRQHLDDARQRLSDVAADGARVGTVVADLADASAAGSVVQGCLDLAGRCDGALVSVGGPAPGPALSLTDDQWRTSFETVFLGALRVVRTLVEHWQDAATGSVAPEPAKAVTLILSTSVKTPIPVLGASNGLRPGLAILVKDLAGQLGPDGIRVNGLMPGRIATERLAELDGLTGDAEAARRQHESLIPLRRYGRPEEFGAMASFLLSPAAGYMTGAVIPVDGGLLPTI